VGGPGPTPSPLQLVEPRQVPLGGPRGLLVARTLPHWARRTVGAWCFADHFGPTPGGTGPGMHVPPQPHIGLQTVTWLIAGQVQHTDGLGSAQPIRPGELNLMTAGHGIAHAEDSADAAGLHGLQLWTALPQEHRQMRPAPRRTAAGRCGRPLGDGAGRRARRCPITGGGLLPAGGRPGPVGRPYGGALVTHVKMRA